MDASRLGDCLRSQRCALGWSQELLAEHSAVSIRTIRNLETGANQNPRRSSLSLIGQSLEEGWRRRGEQHDVGRLLEAALASRSGTRSGTGHRSSGAPDSCWRGMRPPRDELFGRDDIEALCAAVQEQRFVALTGPTGIGKTRLALCVADRIWSHFLDGVVVVELSEFAEATCADVLAAVECAVDAERSWDLLLVLDNAEQVLAATTAAARSILAAHPQTSVLVTSQRPIMGGDCLRYEVGPLSCLPDNDGPSTAARLLLARAANAAPGLDLSGRIDEVERLCAWLDGVPQAIEVAATQLRCLPLEVIGSEQALRLLLNESTVRGLSHGRTLGCGISWSIALLAPEQRDVLRVLAKDGEAHGLTHALELIAPDSSQGIEFLAHLVDSTLLQVAREDDYTYRVSPSVRSCLLAAA